MAVAVAIPTGTSVLTLTSWSMISMAKSIPPMGVLNVAAIPAPVPAAMRVTRCQVGMEMICPKVEPKDDPI